MCARVKLIEAWLKCLHQTLWLLQPGLSWFVENPWVSVEIDSNKGKLSQNWIFWYPPLPAMLTNYVRLGPHGTHLGHTQGILDNFECNGQCILNFVLSVFNLKEFWYVGIHTLGVGEPGFNFRQSQFSKWPFLGCFWVDTMLMRHVESYLRHQQI